MSLSDSESSLSLASLTNENALSVFWTHKEHKLPSFKIFKSCEPNKYKSLGMISFLHFRLLNLKYRYDFSELQIKQAAIFVYISVVKHLFVRTETNALPHYICINPEVNCRVSAVVIHDRNRGDATVGEFGSFGQKLMRCLITYALTLRSIAAFRQWSFTIGTEGMPLLGSLTIFMTRR